MRKSDYVCNLCGISIPKLEQSNIDFPNDAMLTLKPGLVGLVKAPDKDSGDIHICHDCLNAIDEARQ
jgi:hypothetical protein